MTRGHASDLLELHKVLPARKPALIVLDLRSRDTDSLETIKGLRARFPETRMLVLSQLDEATYAERALRAGAMGYVMKDQPQAEVLRAMRTVLRGECSALWSKGECLRRWT